MHFTFQESGIWDGGHQDTPSSSGATCKIKARSLEKAMNKLPPNSSLGRTWILVKTEENQPTQKDSHER